MSPPEVPPFYRPFFLARASYKAYWKPHSQSVMFRPNYFPQPYFLHDCQQLDLVEAAYICIELVEKALSLLEYSAMTSGDFFQLSPTIRGQLQC